MSGFRKLSQQLKQPKFKVVLDRGKNLVGVIWSKTGTNTNQNSKYTEQYVLLYSNLEKKLYMIESIGFSYIGTLFILMLTIPNLIWTKHQPKDYDASNENKYLLIFERIGQVCVTILAVITKSFNINRIDIWLIWLVVAFAIMVIYECWWVRYFKSQKTLADFYSSFLGVSLAGATLPVVAFFILGIYGKSILMMVAIVILGIGHIGIHLEHREQIAND